MMNHEDFGCFWCTVFRETQRWWLRLDISWNDSSWNGWELQDVDKMQGSSQIRWGKWHMKFTTLQAWQASAMGLASQIAAVNLHIGPGQRCKLSNFKEKTFLSSEKRTLKQAVLRLLCFYVHSWTHHEFWKVGVSSLPLHVPFCLLRQSSHRWRVA